MKFAVTTLFLALAGHALGQAPALTVEVYVDAHDDSDRLLGPGKTLASDVYKKIGVRLVWRRGHTPAGRNAIGLHTAEKAPPTATPEALGASEVGGSKAREITIYKDRLMSFLDNHPTIAGVATGYVLAHELAHVMQGIARHTESGILKAHWTEEDFMAMLFHKLAFAPEDVELIHRGLTGGLATGAATQVAGK